MKEEEEVEIAGDCQNGCEAGLLQLGVHQWLIPVIDNNLDCKN